MPTAVVSTRLHRAADISINSSSTCLLTVIAKLFRHIFLSQVETVKVCMYTYITVSFCFGSPRFSSFGECQRVINLNPSTNAARFGDKFLKFQVFPRDHS